MGFLLNMYYAIISAVLYGMAVALEKASLSRVGIGWTYVGYYSTYLPLAIYLSATIPKTPTPDATGILSALASGLIAGIAGYTYAVGLNAAVAPTLVVSVSATYPLISALLFFIFMGARLTLLQFGGCIMIVCGVACLAEDL